MKIKILVLITTLYCFYSKAQTPTDFLPKEFHAKRRDILRSKMPKNSIAVVFSNPIRNRANDVDYVFHQDPNFYYLTGFREPNSALLLFSEEQVDENGNKFKDIIYVPKKDAKAELWNGTRLGVNGVKSKLGFSNVKTTDDFINTSFNFEKFDTIYIEKFKDDYRNLPNTKVDLFDLISSFKTNVHYNSDVFISQNKRRVYELIKATSVENSASVAQGIGLAIKRYPELQDDNLILDFIEDKPSFEKRQIQEKINMVLEQKSKINVDFLPKSFAEMREIKIEEEIKLLTKAIRVSAIGQIEVMKAMKTHMSETEIQGIHEFVYKKYGVEYEGYPSIVGSGHNGCVLHYINNDRTEVGHDLVLMDLGAEYRGYTADVTRTIPASGKFSPEQKAIYEIVLKAQKAGIKASKVGNSFWKPGRVAREIINKGLYELGIIPAEDYHHTYFPHGASHYLGLDVHDPGTYGYLQENSIITVEPGIYIPENSNCDKKWWGIAIRIEDDILITKKGPINLSEEAPRTVEAIEIMMAKKSVLDEFLLPNLD